MQLPRRRIKCVKVEVPHSDELSFDIGNYCSTYAPEYFRQNNNQFPTSAEDTPFQLAKKTPLSYFAWLGENPSLAKDFQQWMTLKQQATPNWVDWFDVQGNLLHGFRNRPDDVLLVDVGGGEGHYLHAFNDKYPDAPGRRILQDLPQVISTINKTPKDTELMAHDFFTVQPVKGTKICFPLVGLAGDFAFLFLYSICYGPTYTDQSIRRSSILYALDTS